MYALGPQVGKKLQIRNNKISSLYKMSSPSPEIKPSRHYLSCSLQFGLSFAQASPETAFCPSVLGNLAEPYEQHVRLSLETPSPPQLYSVTQLSGTGVFDTTSIT